MIGIEHNFLREDYQAQLDHHYGSCRLIKFLTPLVHVCAGVVELHSGGKLAHSLLENALFPSFSVFVASILKHMRIPHALQSPLLSPFLEQGFTLLTLGASRVASSAALLRTVRASCKRRRATTIDRSTYRC